MKKNKTSEKRGLFLGSVIFAELTRFADWICGEFSKSVFGSFLTSYDKTEKICSESAIVKGIKRLFGFDGKGAKAKRKIASVIENSFFTRIGKRIFDVLGNTYMSVIGMFFLSFGIYTLFAGLIKAVALRQDDASFLYFIIPFVCVPLSVPMFLAGKRRLISLLSESKLISPILFSVFGLRREMFKEKNTSGGRRNIAFIFGTVLGVLTYFLPPIIVLAAPVALVAAYAFVLAPEAGMVITLFAVPLLILTGHPSLFLAFILIFLTFCYVMKAVRGKRYVKFEAVDLFMLLFMLLFASGALGGFGGLDVSLPLYVCLSAGYFLCANMFSSRIWLKRGVVALMAGNMISALFAIYQYLSGNVDTVWLDMQNFSNIAGRAVSFFENPNMLGEYAMMLLPVAVALVLSAKERRERSAWMCVAVATALCLIFTWARGAWLGALAAFFVFAVMYSKKTIPFMLLCLVLVPFLPVVLPESIVTRMTSIGDMSDSSTSYRFFIYKSALDMIADFFFTGIGVGSKNFSSVYVSYSYSGIESAPHAHNLFFQLIIELGVLGVIIFVTAMMIYIQSTVTAVTKEKDTYLRGLQLSCACGVFASLVQGMTDYVWYNYRVYFVFFALIGIGVAARRCGERAVERDCIPKADSPTCADIAFVPVSVKVYEDKVENTPDNAEEAVEL